MSDRSPLVLFVCTGNICRSPMAQAIAADMIAKRRLRLRAASAGTAALHGDTASEFANDAVAELGLSLDDHRARSLTRELVTEARLVVTATQRQRDDLRRIFAADRDKIRSFDDLTGLGEVHDPFGGEQDEFRRTAALLARGMPAILSAAGGG